LPNPRANTLRDVHDAFHVAFYEREYVVEQDGKRVVRFVEARCSSKRCVETVRPRREGCEGRMRGLRCVGK